MDVFWQMTGKTKKPDMPVIAGCLRGLTSYLTHFTQSVEEGQHGLQIDITLLPMVCFWVFPNQ